MALELPQLPNPDGSREPLLGNIGERDLPGRRQLSRKVYFLPAREVDPIEIENVRVGGGQTAPAFPESIPVTAAGPHAVFALLALLPKFGLLAFHDIVPKGGRKGLRGIYNLGQQFRNLGSDVDERHQVA